jgi:hypothetical protein
MKPLTAINKCKHDGGDGRCDEASFCIQEIGRLKAALEVAKNGLRKIQIGASQGVAASVAGDTLEKLSR